jgi:hypothetical protein
MIGIFHIIAKTIRMLEVDLLCANLVPQRLEHTQFIVDAIDVLGLFLRILFHDGRAPSSRHHLVQRNVFGGREMDLGTGDIDVFLEQF